MRTIIKNFILLLLLFGCSITTHAQAIEKALEKANEHYAEYNFVRAIEIYERIIKKGDERPEVLKKLANSYYYNADYENAAKWYGKLLEKEEAVEPNYYYRYAQSLKSLKKYDESLVYMQKFKELDAGDKRARIFDTNYLNNLRDNSKQFDIQNYGGNSSFSDFGPSYYKSNLVFTSARDTGTLSSYRHTWDGNAFLNLFYSDMGSNNAKTFSKTINSRFHESTTAFTKDGNTVYFTRSIYKKNKGSATNSLKIYKSVYDSAEDDWSKPEAVSFNGEDYNVAHPSLSPDETILYFASDKPGGFGLSDIYKVAINEDGSFGEPVNMGYEINTPGRETFPFLGSDNYLYFASDGHQGFGGLDIFGTAFDDDDGDVIKIVNLGLPVNSPKDDFSFIFDPESKSGYMASNRGGGKGGDDIYQITADPVILIECDKIIAGYIKDKDDDTIISGAQVVLLNEESEILQEVTSGTDGYFAFTETDCDASRVVKAHKEGYDGDKLYISAESGSAEEHNLFLTKRIDIIDDGKTIVAAEEVFIRNGSEVVKKDENGNIVSVMFVVPTYFGFDKANVTPQAAEKLDKLVTLLRENPSLNMEIHAYTDSRGSDTYNQNLSERRARASVSYLTRNGISRSRIKGQGFGESNLVNDCADGVDCSETQHGKNRRSEYIFVDDKKQLSIN